MAVMNKLDIHLWRRFISIAAPYWFGDKKWEAFGLLAALLLLTVGQNAVSVVLSFTGKDYMTTMTKRDVPAFCHTLMIFAGVMVVSTILWVFSEWLRKRLSLCWRRWLTDNLLNKYFAKQNYYALSYSPQVDNPDERLHEDLDAFTSSAILLPWLLIDSFFRSVSFIAVLWSISKVLVLVVIVYASISSIAAVWLGQRRLFPLDFNQRKAEADFRYHLIQVRDNTESIAFYGGQDWESKSLLQRFHKVAENFNSLIAWRRNMGLLNSAYGFLPWIIPSLILAPLYCKGSIEFGAIGQGANAFSDISGAIAVVILRFCEISSFAAVINRLGQFNEIILAIDNQAAAKQEMISIQTGQNLFVEDLTITTPNSRDCLVEHLSFALKPAERLLVVGPSGAGKSSLLRVISGLWRTGSGKLVRPDLNRTLFLPQRPYMVLGSLREQLLYPLREKVEIKTDKEIMSALALVNLADLPARFGGLDVVLNWADVLSPGEQQRLAFARLILAEPVYAILDESTSALDIENERSIYALLKKRHTTYLSVAHRNSVINFHDRVLRLAGDGSWSLIPASDYAKDSKVSMNLIKQPDIRKGLFHG